MALTKKAIAIDCEMVKTISGQKVARVACVDEDLEKKLKTFVHVQNVIDYVGEITGISKEDLTNAPSLSKVVGQIKEIIRYSSVVVGHGVRQDLDLLGIGYNSNQIRDTSDLPIFLKPNGNSNKLKYLAETYLNETIQNGVHDPEVDARTAMKLYKQKWNLPGPAQIAFIKRNRPRSQHNNSLYYDYNNKEFFYVE